MRSVNAGASARDFPEFTVHPYEGRDFIVQSLQRRSPAATEYGLARRLADGLYMVIPISEEDADEPTRERFCTKTQDASCRIATPERRPKTKMSCQENGSKNQPPGLG